MIRKHINNILFKEWRVLTGEPTTFLLITLLPFAILGEGFLAIWLVSVIGGEAIANNPFFQRTLETLLTGFPRAAALPELDRVKLLLLSQFNLFILLIPTMIAIYTASYSIVEEKISRSLEALLTTPVKTWELLLGKALSGFIPALGITWLCAAISLAAVALIGWGYLLPHYLNAAWFLNLFLITPGIALLSFLLGVIGSSKAKDFRNAQNLVFLIVLPVLGLIALQITGVIWFTPLLMGMLGLAIYVIDLLVLRASVHLFRRESILVAWR